MELREDRLQAWCDLLIATGETGPSSKIAAEIREDVEAGKRDLRHTRVHSERDVEFLAGIRVAQIHKSSWFLTALRVHPSMDKASRVKATNLVSEAVQIARRDGATRISSYVPVSILFEDYRRALSEARLSCTGMRIEFSGPVQELPSEGETPFRWEAMQPGSRSLAEQTLARAAVGDPETQEGEDPRGAMEKLLGEPKLNSDDDCVHVGFLEEAPAAIVVAQIMPSTGWSRISYMGLIPDFRGQGLGRFVHAHGFAMMKAQGGQRYEGGTSSANKAMLALFSRAGVEETTRFEVWKN